MVFDITRIRLALDLADAAAAPRLALAARLKAARLGRRAVRAPAGSGS
jgi:hypothetical protein